ncbi:MAG: glycosyl hydrolase [Minisyncoccia bacterium]
MQTKSLFFIAGVFILFSLALLGEPKYVHAGTVSTSYLGKLIFGSGGQVTVATTTTNITSQSPSPVTPPPPPVVKPTPVTPPTIVTDVTSPVISISFPLQNSVVSGTSTALKSSASDNVAVIGVLFKIDNRNIGVEDLAFPFETILNAINYSNGTHSIVAVARDLAGNISTSSQRFIIINNTYSPPISVTPTPSPLPAIVSDKISTSSTQTNLATTTKRKMIWGAYIGDSKADLATFESLVGKPMNVRSVFYSMGDNFPLQYKTSIGEAGKTLLLFWEPSFGYDSIINGSKDEIIKKFALDAKAYTYPIILSPFHEMNGNWSPWGYGVNGNSPTKFITAWKKIKDMFIDVPNVKFALVYNSVSKPNVVGNQITDYYPGSSYVDYVGVDGFNFGTPWISFNTIFNDSLTKLSKYNKPIYIFSMGSVPGIEKANWIRDALGVQIYKYPLIEGWIWFNQNGWDGNWIINSDQNSLNAFKEIIPK